MLQRYYLYKLTWLWSTVRVTCRRRQQVCTRTPGWYNHSFVSSTYVTCFTQCNHAPNMFGPALHSAYGDRCWLSPYASTTDQRRQLHTAWRCCRYPRVHDQRLPRLAPWRAAHTHPSGSAVALQPDLLLTGIVRDVLQQAAAGHWLANCADCMDSIQSQEWHQLMNMQVYCSSGLSQNVQSGGAVRQEPATVVLEVPLQQLPALVAPAVPAAYSQEPPLGGATTALVMLVGASR